MATEIGLVGAYTTVTYQATG